MHIEILCEDKSGSVVLEYITARFLQDNDFDCTYAIRPHRGKGRMPDNFLVKPNRFASGLMDLLPAKVRAYADVYAPNELILVVVMDSDNDSYNKIYTELERVMQKFGCKLPYVIGISVEEMESWLLGDRQAILSAYPQASMTVIDNYEQDSICGTWEVLARAIYGNSAERLIKIGYPAIGQYKYEWASTISPYLKIYENKSPSFKRYIKQLTRVMVKNGAGL